MSTKCKTWSASKKRKAEDDPDAAASAGDNKGSSEDTDVSRTFPYCEGSDLDSDGSDYDCDEDEKVRATDPSWTRGNYADGDVVMQYDKKGRVREPAVNMMFHMAIVTGRWDDFVQLIRDHPGDARQGYLISDSIEWDAESMLHPSYLHAFLQRVKLEDEDIDLAVSIEWKTRRVGVIEAIIKAHPDSLKMYPSAFCEAAHLVPRSLPPEILSLLFEACPSCAKVPRQTTYLDNEYYEYPIHAIIARVQYPNASVIDSLTKLVPKLSRSCPQALFQPAGPGFPCRTAGYYIDPTNKREHSISFQIWDEEADIKARANFYLAVLRELTKVYCGLAHNANLNEVDKHILFAAAELESRFVMKCVDIQHNSTIAQPLQRIVLEMPHLARHQDENGDYPLSHAVENLVVYLWKPWCRVPPRRQNASAVDYVKTLIELNPAAVTTPVSSNRRLPLHLALAGDLNYGFYINCRASACIDALLDVAPRTVTVRDPVTGLHPFMLAAVGDQRPLMGYLVDVGLVYNLLRRDPSVIDTS